MGNTQANHENKESKHHGHKTTPRPGSAKKKNFMKFGKKLLSTSSKENVIDGGEFNDVFIDKRKSAGSQQSVDKISDGSIRNIANNHEVVESLNLFHPQPKVKFMKTTTNTSTENNTNTVLTTKEELKREPEPEDLSSILVLDTDGSEKRPTAASDKKTKIIFHKCVDNNNDSIIIQTDSFKTVKCLNNSISCDDDNLDKSCYVATASNEQNIHIIKDQTTSSSDSDFTDPQLTPVDCHAEINQCYQSEENVAGSQSGDFDLVDHVKTRNYLRTTSCCETAFAQQLAKLTINKTQLFSFNGTNNEQEKILKNLKIDQVTNICLSGFCEDKSKDSDNTLAPSECASETIDVLNFIGVDYCDESNLSDESAINTNDEMPQNFRSRIPTLSSNNDSSGDKTTSDRSIFSVSRIKKVELSEITPKTQRSPKRLATTPTTANNKSLYSNDGHSIKHSSISQPITPTTPGGNGNVLRKVANAEKQHLTAANGDQRGSRTFVPEKLNFALCEKFEGQMLMNWLASSFQALPLTLNEQELITIALQYCTNLLTVGVINQIPDKYAPIQDTFKPSLMYRWSRSEALTIPLTPGKLEANIIWPHSDEAPEFLPNKETKSANKPTPLILNTSTPLKASATSPVPDIAGTVQQPENVDSFKSMLKKFETVSELYAALKHVLVKEIDKLKETSNPDDLVEAKNRCLVFTEILNSSECTIFDQGNISCISENSVAKELSPTTPKVKNILLQELTIKECEKVLTDEITTQKQHKCVGTSPINGRSPSKTDNDVPIGKIIVGTCSKETQTDLPELICLKETQTHLEQNGEQAEKLSKTSVPPMPPPLPPAAPCRIPVPPAMPGPVPPPPPPPFAIPGPPPPPPPFPGAVPGPPPPPFPGGVPGGIPGAPLPPPPIPPGGSASSAYPSVSQTGTGKLATGPRPPLPLPMPVPGFYQTNNILRKKAVNPPKPMKPLYWTRIIAPPIPAAATTPVDEVDESAASAAAAAEAVNAENELAAKKKFELWQEIDETSIDNLDEFTELFSRQGVVPKPKEKTEKPVKVQSIKILDSKRSQSVGIFSRSLHVDFDEIEHAIYHCDTSVVSLEALQQIMEIKANPEELDQIKQVAQTDALLDAPEKFLLKISDITSFSERISCIILQAEFDEAVTIVSRKLETIKQLCIFLMDNEDLKTLFSIILTLGNYMNGGNRTRGQADGFGLEILPKLKDVKSKDSKITLLHFIVKTYISQCRKRGTPLTEIVLPIPDPTDINKCVSIDFEDSKIQLTVLKNKLTDCEKMVEKVLKESNENNIEPFKEKMASFLEGATQRIERQFKKLDGSQKLFVKAMVFYKFIPKSGTLNDTTPGQFFECWTTFTHDFRDIWKKEMAILSNELLKKAQIKPIKKPATTKLKSGNLKDRLMSKLNKAT